MSAPALLKKWAQQSPFSTALIIDKVQINWQTLELIIDDYASTLRSQGLGCGDVLVFVGKNQPEFPLVYLACLRLGILPAICPPQPLAQLKRKLETLYVDTQVPLIWMPNASELPLSKTELDLLASTNQIVNVTPLHLLELSSGKQDESVLEAPLRHPKGLSSIVFTSGSTGDPKAVAHTSKQHIASAKGLLELFEYQTSDRWLLSLPMYHVSGLAIIWRWLVAGGELKIGSGDLDFDIQEVTHASLVSTQLKRLLDSKQPLTLKRVLLGGSHISHTLAQQAQSVGIDTWLGYGMTEAASTVTAKRLDSVSSAGSLLPKRKLKIVDQRIYISGETLASGYYHQGQLQPLNKSGWFDSKDLGQWQSDELVVLGRADNQFISGGENIHCEEIEAVLNRYPQIRQSFIIPVEDAEFGFRPVAIIDSETLEENSVYRQYLNGKLDKFKFPIAYFQMPEMESVGIKVSRKALSNWLHQTDWMKQRSEKGE